jgi:hypothetical protein
MNRDPNWERWVKWLGRSPDRGTIYGDVLGLQAARHVWNGFQDITYVAPDEGKKYGTFHSLFNQNYIRAQGLGVRRQVEVRKDVVSLGRLLDGVAKNAGAVTRRRFLHELYAEESDFGNEFFDELAGPGLSVLDPAIPRGQLDRLESETKQVREWVSKEVAHFDPATGSFSEQLTFGDVHRCVDLLFETMNFYHQLLLGQTVDDRVTMAPWEAVFRVQWIPDDGAWTFVTSRRGPHR